MVLSILDDRSPRLAGRRRHRQGSLRRRSQSRPDVFNRQGFVGAHQRPIFPEVALALIELAGFTRAHVVFPLGTLALIEDRQTQGEYAVVATVDGDN